MGRVQLRAENGVGGSPRGRALTATSPGLPPPHRDLPTNSFCPLCSSPSLDLPAQNECISRVVNRKPCRGRGGGGKINPELCRPQATHWTAFQSSSVQEKQNLHYSGHKHAQTPVCAQHRPCHQSPGPRLWAMPAHRTVDNNHYAWTQEAVGRATWGNLGWGNWTSFLEELAEDRKCAG